MLHPDNDAVVSFRELTPCPYLGRGSFMPVLRQRAATTPDTQQRRGGPCNRQIDRLRSVLHGSPSRARNRTVASALSDFPWLESAHEAICLHRQADPITPVTPVTLLFTLFTENRAMLSSHRFL